MIDSQTRAVVLFNPLKLSLAHYTEALASNLTEAGVVSQVVETALEIGRRPLAQRLLLASRAIPAYVRVARSSSLVVIVWPMLGMFDLVLWKVLSPRHSRRLVVVHDPVPLRRQVGYGRTAYWLAALATRRGAVQVIAHTKLAAAEIERRGVHVSHILPHPIQPRTRPRRTKNNSLVVAGHYKESRDLELLASIAKNRDGLKLTIVGSGWPRIEGWEVVNRFVTESELDEVLTGAGAVLIPYARYFQSGIAARCFELGAPVLATRHEFLEHLYGSDWAGFYQVGDGYWSDLLATTTAANVPDHLTSASAAAESWCSVTCSR